MLAYGKSSKERLNLEHKVLSEAFKHSFETGDKEGAALAHKGLMAVLQQQLFSGDGSSTGSVIPASFWQKAQENALRQEAEVEANRSNMPTGQPETSLTGADGPDVAGSIAAQTGVPVAGSSDGELAAQALADMSAAAALDFPVATAEEIGLTPDSELPQGGPSAYLDFGDDDNASTEPAPPVPAPPGASTPVPLPEPEPPPRTPSQLIRAQTFYQIIGVNSLSSFEEIHLKFLRIMRRLLRSRYAEDSPIKDMREFREVLRAICVAHDVLKDPQTRTDYDLRQLGMRNAPSPEAAEQPKGIHTRTRLMLGELLECANILETTELEIALDMHKAEPGIQFGEFLVRAGFLNRDELDGAILGQRLISSGKITVAQFQTAMWKMRDDGTSFFDTLMTEGWLSPSDIFDENSDLWGTPSMHGTNDAPVTTTVKAEPPPWLQEPPATPPAAESQEEVPAKISAQNAIPQWANDLEWDEASAAEAKSTLEQSTTGALARYGEGWSERDTMAETQALDMKALRAVLEAEVKDPD